MKIKLLTALFFLTVCCSVAFAQSSQNSTTSPFATDSSSGLPEGMPKIPGADSPEMAERQRDQQQLNQVVIDYREGKISKEEAQRKLFPLVKKAMPAISQDDIDSQIENYTQQLDYLKKLKKDPDYAAKERVSILLGLTKEDVTSR